MYLLLPITSVTGVTVINKARFHVAQSTVKRVCGGREGRGRGSTTAPKRANISRSSGENEMRAAGSHNRKHDEEDGRQSARQESSGEGHEEESGAQRHGRVSPFCTIILAVVSGTLVHRQTDRHSHARTTQRGPACLCLVPHLVEAAGSKYISSCIRRKEADSDCVGSLRLRGFSPGSSHRPKTCTSHWLATPNCPQVWVWRCESLCVALRWTGHSSRDASHLQPQDIWDGLQQQQDLGEVKEQSHRPRMDEWTATFGSCSNKSAVHPTIGTKWRQENWLPDKFQPPACCLPEAPTHFSRVVRLTLDACARWSHPEGTTCRGGARPSIIPTAFAEVVNTSQALLWVTTTSQPYVAVTHVSRKSLMAANAPDDAVEPSHDAKKSSRASSTLLISEFSPKHLCSEPTETVSGSIKYVWGRLLNIIFCDLKEG